jgi:hypothetical protein
MDTESADPQGEQPQDQAQAQSEPTAPGETPAGGGGMFPGPGAVVTIVVQRARPVARMLMSPLLDVVWPMVVAEGVRRTDLAAAIAKDVEAALAKVDLNALVLEKVDLDAVVKTALENADPDTLAKEIAAAQQDAERQDEQRADGQDDETDQGRPTF